MSYLGDDDLLCVRQVSDDIGPPHFLFFAASSMKHLSYFPSFHALLSPSYPSPTHLGAPGARPVVTQPENDPTGGGALAVHEQIVGGAQSVPLGHDGQASGKWQAAFRPSGRFPPTAKQTHP